MAPASDNNNQDLATKKAKLETSNNTTATVLGGVGELKVDFCFFFVFLILCYMGNLKLWEKKKQKFHFR